jgi:manganese/zinc/iron transport system permease protein
LTSLEEQEFIHIYGNQWAMTEKGFNEAETIYNQLGQEND